MAEVRPSRDRAHSKIADNTNNAGPVHPPESVSSYSCPPLDGAHYIPRRNGTVMGRARRDSAEAQIRSSDGVPLQF